MINIRINSIAKYRLLVKTYELRFERKKHFNEVNNWNIWNK